MSTYYTDMAKSEATKAIHPTTHTLGEEGTRLSLLALATAVEHLAEQASSSQDMICATEDRVYKMLRQLPAPPEPTDCKARALLVLRNTQDGTINAKALPQAIAAAIAYLEEMD